MKKSNQFSAALVLLISVILLSACSKSVEYANVIPVDASAVVSIDLNALTQKSGLNENKAVKQKLTDVLKSGLNADALQYMERLMKEPAESGLSASDNIYIFTMAAAETTGLVAKVTDMNKVKELFKLLEQEQISMPLQDTGVNGYQLTFLNEKDVVCFNENTLLIVIGKDAFSSEHTESVAKMMIAQTAEQSVSTVEGFKIMSAKKEDIVAYVTMDVMPNEYAFLLKDNMPEGLSLKDYQFVGTLNFEKGKIQVAFEGVKNEALEKYQKRYERLVSKQNTEYMNYFPESSLFYMGASIDGEKLVEVISSVPEARESIKRLGEQFDIESVLKSIDGDIVYGMSSLSAQGSPALTCFVKVKNDELLNTLNKSLGGMAKQESDGNYSVAMGMGLNAYYGMKDGVFFFAIDQDAKNVWEKKKNSLADEWASEAKGTYMFTLMNIQDALKQPMVNLMMSMGGKEAALIRKVMSQFDYVECTVPDMNKCTLDIVMTNQNENALKQLFALGEQFAGIN